MVKRGVPKRHDGMEMFKKGSVTAFKSSMVRGRTSPPVSVITTRWVPHSVALGPAASWIVLSERARRCFRERSRFGTSGMVVMAPRRGESLGVSVHWLVCVGKVFEAAVSCGLEETEEVPGGVSGRFSEGGGWLVWFGRRIDGLYKLQSSN